MEYSIKTENQKLILSSAENKFEGKDFFLKPGVKLSDVFEFLPYGRINKKETGIGATTLEIRSPRHSIIVQPIRATAKSKSEKEQNLFYFDADDKKIELKLNQYLADSSIAWKKIILVIDSLPRLLALHKEFMQDYFLLIDEIDSIQRDSSYRNKLEYALNYYKLFNNDKRALVSATLLSFSDKKLEKEPLTKFEYEGKVKRKVNITITNKPHDTGYQELKQLLLNENLKQKVVVAYNSVKKIEEYAMTLVKEGIVEAKEISLLIGNKIENQRKREKYNRGLIENGLLPARVNFITQAYFSGFDILEDTALIIVVDVNSSSTRLSFQEIQQIAGRCRKKTVYFSVVASTYYPEKYKEVAQKILSKTELIAIAKKQLSGLNCMSSHFSGDSREFELLSKLRDLMIKQVSDYVHGLVSRDLNNQLTISYLAIDSKLIDYNAQKVFYQNREKFIDVFRKNNFDPQVFSRSVDTEFEKSDKKQDTQDILNQMFDMLKANRESFFSIADKSILNSEQYKLLKSIYELAIQKYSAKNVLKVIEDNLTMKQLKIVQLNLQHMHFNKNSFFKRNLKFHLPVGSKLSYDELIEKIHSVLIEANLIANNEKFKGIALMNIAKALFSIKRKGGIYYIESERKFDYGYRKKSVKKIRINN
jgi:hypothetical protein